MLVSTSREEFQQDRENVLDAYAAAVRRDTLREVREAGRNLKSSCGSGGRGPDDPPCCVELRDLEAALDRLEARA